MAQSSVKKRIRYSTEKLNLLCEWENCVVVQTDMDVFLHHIINEHLTKLDPGDLHCHWKDCEGFTDNLSEFRRHILLHAFHTKIKCYGANLQVRRKLPNCLSSIQSRNIVPELPEPLLCGWEDCTTEYECAEYFYRHVDLHAENDSRRDKSTICLWQDCGRTFTDRHKVRDHLRSHTQEKLVSCPTCGGMFASRTKFFEHIQRQQIVDESKTEIYACEYCPKKMVSERLLRDHIRHHVNHYKCPYCDMTCPTPSDLANHVAYRHSKEKPHACQYCDYRSKTESDLRKHLESHSMVPTYKCPVENCSYASRSLTCFRAHYRKAHEGKHPMKYSCHLCEKAFSRGNYLTKHLMNHHKFRWPSGHCRFRYCLNAEGVYQLQTVRYESLELSEEMMGENSEMVTENDEDVDNPELRENTTKDTGSIRNVDSDDNNLSKQYIPQNSHIPDSSLSVTSEETLIPNSSVALSQIPNSVVYHVDKKRSINNPEALPVVYVPYVSSTDGQTISEEPVLIKILEAKDYELTTSYSKQAMGTQITDFNGSEFIESVSKNDGIKDTVYDNAEITKSQNANKYVFTHMPNKTLTNNSLLGSDISQIPLEPVELNKGQGQSGALPSMPCVTFPDSQNKSEEPVLIKILDAHACTESSFSEQTFMRTSEGGCEIGQSSTVQCMTADSTGSLVFHTIQITEQSEVK